MCIMYIIMYIHFGHVKRLYSPNVILCFLHISAVDSDSAKDKEKKKETSRVSVMSRMPHLLKGQFHGA